MENKKIKIYLDDIRTPIDNDWVVVRNYKEFIDKVNEIGFDNIDFCSIDHDLSDDAMIEYYNNVKTNYKLLYENIVEKTGYDVAKWIVEQWMNGEKVFPVYCHSANPIGSANILGYINNYLMNNLLPQTCVRIRVEHTIE